ncbi:MAG: YlxM family DNA-binding protein [Clostridia bacterium]|nr:YlxM family DNA-binding protein [Clostridia bacterium]
MIEKMHVADLFAFYGELLTEKQKDVLELYCLEDLSLGEIAEDLNISRQGVFDNVKRATKTLESYELKLGLMAKFNSNKMLFNDISQKMNDLSHVIKTSESLKDLKAMVNQVTEDVIRDIHSIEE